MFMLILFAFGMFGFWAMVSPEGLEMLATAAKLLKPLTDLII